MIKPILFSTEMVRAILEGRKTVTRRVISAKKIKDVLSSPAKIENPDIPDKRIVKCLCYAPYDPGDILWVRETWTRLPVTPGGHFRPQGVYYYKAGEEMRPEKYRENGWHPSIHMPKEAARLFLRVKSVRVEKLQEIDGFGILSEGIDNGKSNPKMGERWGNMQLMAFSKLWDSTIKSSDLSVYGWACNPWVWVIEFKRISKNELELEKKGYRA